MENGRGFVDGAGGWDGVGFGGYGWDGRALLAKNRQVSVSGVWTCSLIAVEVCLAAFESTYLAIAHGPA